jgi:hypothetical protein
MCDHCRQAATDAGRAVVAADHPALAGLDFSRSAGSDVGPVVLAQYDGPCAGDCGEWIYVGDEIRMVDGEAVHAGCA